MILATATEAGDVAAQEYTHTGDIAVLNGADNVFYQVRPRTTPAPGLFKWQA